MPLDKITNKSVYERVRQQPLSVKLARRQLTWVGHMLRRNDDEPIRKYSLYEPAEKMGKSKKGRHKTTYKQHIANLLNKDISLSAKEIENAAQNRISWKKLVIACTDADG